MEEVRFYSPLYARKFEDDEEVEIWPNELLMYKDEILTALASDYRFPNEKGLMEYFDEDKTVAEKVYSAFPTVEEFDKELYGVMIVRLKESLTKEETNMLKDYFRGQYSDGWAKDSSRGRLRQMQEIFM